MTIRHYVRRWVTRFYLRLSAVEILFVAALGATTGDWPACLRLLVVGCAINLVTLPAALVVALICHTLQEDRP